MPKEYNGRIYHLTGRTTAKQRETTLAYYYDNRERILAEAKRKRKERRQKQSTYERTKRFFPPLLTDQQIALAKEMRREGMSWRKLANSLGISESAVYSALNSWEESDDPEYFKKYTKKHRQEHPEHLKKYQKACLAKRSAHDAKRRALIVSSMVGDVTGIAELYHQAKEASGIRCYICGDLISTGEGQVDHIIPLSRGGPTVLSNLAIVHTRCNLRKKDKLPEEIDVYDKSVIERARQGVQVVIP